MQNFANFILQSAVSGCYLIAPSSPSFRIIGRYDWLDQGHGGGSLHFEWVSALRADRVVAGGVDSFTGLPACQLAQPSSLSFPSVACPCCRLRFAFLWRSTRAPLLPSMSTSLSLQLSPRFFAHRRSTSLFRSQFLDAQDCTSILSQKGTRTLVISIVANSYVIAIALPATRPISSIVLNPQPTVTFTSGNIRSSLARQPCIIDHNGRLQQLWWL